MWSFSCQLNQGFVILLLNRFTLVSCTLLKSDCDTRLISIGYNKLLTIGISSVQRPQGSYLLDTLRSLFFASSLSEQKYFTVLVHLADPDPNWLDQMISNISTLFQPYIQARQLVVINTPLKSYLPLKNLKKNF
ncbi:hypothetical protein H8959_017529 [Pygathrix nigripes]